jgi:hypothetical protein
LIPWQWTYLIPWQWTYLIPWQWTYLIRNTTSMRYEKIG